MIQWLRPLAPRFLVSRELLGNSFFLSFIALVLGPAATQLYAQTFLEKLEAAVRQQIDQSKDSTPKNETPTENQPNAKRTPPPIPSPNQAPSEELPAPSSGAAERMPSILEVPAPSSSDSTLQLTPNAPAEGRIYLGLMVEELLGGGIGVRVAEITENSPAWKAGFKVGDHIQGIDGHAIASIDSMADRLRRIVPGNPTKFLVNRSGRNVELVAVLQDAEIANRIRANIANSQANGPAWLGATVNDISAAFRAQFGLTIFSGAAVITVASGSPAQLAGIKPGDAIVEVSGVPVTQGEDLRRWIAQSTVGTPADFVIYRGTQRLAMSIVLSTDPRFASVVERQKPTSPSIARPASNGSGNSPSTSALQDEVDQLRAELMLTQQQLQQTQLQLEQVLQRLEQQP